jgi:hypothetical protein
MTYDRLKGLNTFSDDINKFISFMVAEGFLDKYNLNYEDWLHSNNWNLPLNEDFSIPPIIEVSKMYNGEKYIKQCLADLDFWKLY